MQINSSTPPIIPFHSSSAQAVEGSPQVAKETGSTSNDMKEALLLDHSGASIDPLHSPVAAVSGYLTESSSLKSNSGSVGIPIKVATAVYALNHSFDPQKQMIDVLI